MELIEADYAIDLSIADIARQVGVSADHLTRQFNRHAGYHTVGVSEAFSLCARHRAFAPANQRWAM